MKNKVARVKQMSALGGAVLVMALLGTGCCTGGGGFAACRENVQRKYPVITCQPMDQEVNAGKTAKFYVKAKGKNLKYQWFYIGGGISAEPELVPGATQPLLVIPAVVPRDHYGLYFCAVYRGEAGSRHIVTHSRQATLGGIHSGGAGGTFASTQNALQGSGPNSVCGYSVGARWVAFPGTQTPEYPQSGWRGNLWKVVNGVEVRILRSTYYLQWRNENDVAQKDCCTDVPTSTTEEVQCSLVPGNPYSFTAYFKSGQAPPLGTTIIIKGTWTQ